MRQPVLQITVDTTNEPVLLQTAKDDLRVLDNFDDNLITRLITVSRQICEDYTGLALVPRTYSIFYDCWPIDDVYASEWWDGVRDTAISLIYGKARSIELPKPPFTDVNYVKTYDDADVSTVFPTANYWVDSGSPKKPARFVLRNGVAWPIALRSANAIEINFSSGFANAGVVPPAIVHSILMICAYLYRNRGDGVGANVATLTGAAPFLDQWKIVNEG